jgi:hypothetical protein
VRESKNNGFDAEAEIIRLRLQVEQLQNQVTAMATALNNFMLADQTPAEEQIRETTETIYDWAAIENSPIQF